MPVDINTLTQSLSGFLPVIIFIVTQILGYVKLKGQVENLLKNLNGLGTKLREVEKQLGEHEIEQVLRQSHITDRLAHVEGLLEGIFKPKIQRNGQA